HLRVAPVILVLRVTEPMIGDAGAAGESDFTIDDQNLAVGSIVHFFEVVPLERIEAPDVATSGLEALQILRLHAAGPNRVDNQVHMHTPPSHFLESGSELICDFTGVVDVGLETDAPLC